MLVLLTIWCLVALVAMAWNTGEYAMRRQHLQNAADSDAHAAATWMSRTTNQITMQNMVIAQNGATDVIARSLKPTHDILEKKITGELAAAAGIPQQFIQEVSSLDKLVGNIKTQYAVVSTSLDQLDADLQRGAIVFPNQKASDDYKNKVRQARYAVNWIENNYIPQLEAIVEQLDERVKAAIQSGFGIVMQATVKQYIPKELDVLQDYWDQVSPYTDTDVQTTLAGNESLIFQEQGTVAESLPDTVESQRSAFESFYRTNIAHTDVSAPVMIADKADRQLGLSHFDSIRAKYSNELNLPIMVDIDPINPNTAPPNDPTMGSAVVYPNPIAQIGGQLIAINCNVPGGWGHCWAFPIEHYFSDRVSKDMNFGLQQQFFQNGSTGIDDLRVELAQASGIKWIGTRCSSPSLIARQPSLMINSTPILEKIDLIPVFPSLSNSGGTETNTDADFSYRRSIGQYKSSIQLLISRIQTFGAFLDAFTVPIAVPTWQGSDSNQPSHRLARTWPRQRLYGPQVLSTPHDPRLGPARYGGKPHHRHHLANLQSKPSKT